MNLGLIIAIAVGYLLGSIPFGLLLTRQVGIDIRTVGSGNIGTTNVLRTGNKGLAAATLLLDAGKGALAVVLAREFVGVEAGVLAGVAALVGHCWPAWLHFRGGKGVATILGIALALAPFAGIAALLVWLGGALVTRYSSVGGMLAAVSTPLLAWGLGAPHSAIALAVLAAIVIGRHHDNIARLRNGTESRIGQK